MFRVGMNWGGKKRWKGRRDEIKYMEYPVQGKTRFRKEGATITCKMEGARQVKCSQQ